MKTFKPCLRLLFLWGIHSTKKISSSLYKTPLVAVTNVSLTIDSADAWYCRKTIAVMLCKTLRLKCSRFFSPLFFYEGFLS
ncbi:hypothetical protein CEXT_771751 [Caerostris extrusa]|uniref:Secreted protein n=1 Tax=Caerostris extrusa TaxID=172846 RepID=A0AAV4YEK5_CAEEX|nr:hypothetical protein CEXT_771751 [Caerostris extrusa]